jgi:hypothetical protein
VKSLHDFIVEPFGGRYTNKKKVGDKTLILNSEIAHHQYVNRIGVVKSLPLIGETSIKIGDQVVVHHNIFRRWHNIRGEEKNSKGYIDDKNYLCTFDQIFAYKRNNKWKPVEGYSFVKPIESNDIFSLDKEQQLVGVLVYSDETNSELKEGDLIGFTPSSEYEFIIDGERLYRVRSKNLTIKYEYQGKEKEYNPSWL